MTTFVGNGEIAKAREDGAIEIRAERSVYSSARTSSDPFRRIYESEKERNGIAQIIGALQNGAKQGDVIAFFEAEVGWGVGIESRDIAHRNNINGFCQALLGAAQNAKLDIRIEQENPERTCKPIIEALGDENAGVVVKIRLVDIYNERLDPKAYAVFLSI